MKSPLTDLSAAVADGFRDVLTGESPKAASKPTPEAEQQTVSQYRQAEIKREEFHDQLERDVEEGSVIWKLPAMIRLWWFLQRDGLLRQCRTSGLSVAIHVALLLLLSTVFLVDERITNPDFLTVSNAVEETIQEVVIQAVEIEVTDPVEEVVEKTSEPMVVLSEVTEQFVSIDVTKSFDSNMLAAPKSAGSAGDGDAMEKPTKAKVQFFGSKTEAIDFVFVIDNSNSMTKGRFETALNELVKAVSKLNKRQKFYVIFYSDTAYPLFHPYSPRTLVAATPQNKQLLSRWLQTVPLCLKTNGREALLLGLSLNPDVMFVLGDGAFTDKASQYFSSNPNKNVVIHTLGMEVSAGNAKTFKQLAISHRGTYQDVGVHPQAALIAQKFPRKRNNTKNGYWGLKLPLVAKKKK